MPHGGKRERAGRKKGGRNQDTLDKQTAEAEYRKFLQTHHLRLWSAALEAACGSFLLFRRTEDGAVQVTDPAEMARLLGQPQTKGQHWYLECRRPDATLMKELHHRLMGPPTQIVEVSGSPSQPIHIVHQQIE
jgi:hypothetical protein